MHSVIRRLTRFLRNLVRKKKIFGISSSLSLLLLTIFITTLFYSITDLSITQTDPIGYYEYSDNIDKLDFHKEEDLKEKVNNYRELYKKEIPDHFVTDKFKPYELPEVSFVRFTVDSVHDIDEPSSTVVAGGYVEAFWQDDSIQKFNLPSEDMVYEKTRKDFLSTSILNFYDAENQLYKKIILDESKIDGITYKHSKYRFQGRFRLYRDLRKFPFDSALFRITLTNPIQAPDIELFTDRDSQITEPTFRVNSYRFKKQLCWENDKKGDEQWSCTYDELKPIYSIGNTFKEINKVSDNFVNQLSDLDYAPVAVISSLLQRSAPSSFFRYVVPLMFGIVVLALTDQITTKYLEIRVATPATILLTFIFMQSGYQSEFPQLSYITYMDKLYFLSYLLAVLDLANAIVFINPKNKIHQLCIRYLHISFSTFIRSVFGLLAVFGPFILYLTS